MSALMTVLMAGALALVAYGHQMPIGPDLSNYAMPDGTLPVLCGGSGGDAPAQHSHTPCPACTIAHTIDFPVPSAQMLRGLSVQIINWPQPNYAVAVIHFARAPPARGPPNLLLI